MIRFTLMAVLGLCAVAPTIGAEDALLQGASETISSDVWTLSGLSSTFEFTDSGLRADLQIARIVLTESGQTFNDSRVICEQIGLTTRNVSCQVATFDVAIPGIGRQRISGSFSYDRNTATTTIDLVNIAVAGGQLSTDITANESGVEIQYTGKQLQLAGLMGLASEFTGALSDYDASGIASVSGKLYAPANAALRFSVIAELDQSTLTNRAGTVAADGVQGELQLDVTMDGNRNTMALLFESDQGEAYFEPAYASFSDHPLLLRAEDIVTSDFAAFDIGQFRLQQAAILDVEGSAALNFPADDSPPQLAADIEFRDSLVSNLYTSVAQVQLAGTLFGDLEIGGQLSGSVSIANNSLRSATLSLNDLILDDRLGRFAVYGLHGGVDWRSDEEQLPAVSELRWDSGTAHDIVFGSSEIKLQLGDNDVELLAPMRLPTLGGALLINELVLRDFGGEGATGTLDAELEPVQLGQLTGAFGWPAFSGTLSGKLPLLQLFENTITVGGTLSANAFDGRIEVSKLRIEQPFGRVPRMRGELTFRDLDLQRVTDAFSFGLIQGRLSGDVVGLELQNWRPVAMDLHFYTPTDEKTQRRISQRAVENLASVGGGGAAAVLSTGFLQFFEVFAYDRIGIRCLLKNGVCAMSGAGPASTGPQGNGYYIVKGRGIPRIDVVGYRDAVSWSRLSQQLAAISRSGSPTVK